MPNVYKQGFREEKRALLANRWDTLPKKLQLPNQIAGRGAIACGATHHVMEKCNFSCTCCYLGVDANKTEPLPFEEVCEQLDHLREQLGDAGKVQITAGEVTLLPLEDLGEIVAYARSIGLDPMVMSHGQRFMEEPEYLESLVRDYGLRKISIHIDTTQRGRAGTNSKMSEKDLHAVRDAFADLIRQTRRKTGCSLHAASTVTVTQGNLEEMEEVTRWFFANADAFRLLSFQPVASVGRTRKAYDTAVLSNELWGQVCMSAGRKINPTPLVFGHPDCNNIVPLLIVRVGGEDILFEGIREKNKNDEEMFSHALKCFGPTVQWDRHWSENVSHFCDTFFSNPRLLVRSMFWSVKRCWDERSRLWQLVKLVILSKSLPELRPFLLVVHRFMNAEELDTDKGKERLDACVFKLPVDGEMISMCEMNAREIRAKIDKRMIFSKAS